LERWSFDGSFPATADFEAGATAALQMRKFVERRPMDGPLLRIDRTQRSLNLSNTGIAGNLHQGEIPLPNRRLDLHTPWEIDDFYVHDVSSWSYTENEIATRIRDR
jgi:hypothetical protein